MASCDLAATSLFLPTIKGDREERAWERGCFLFATRGRDSKVSLLEVSELHLVDTRTKMYFMHGVGT